MLTGFKSFLVVDSFLVRGLRQQKQVFKRVRVFWAQTGTLAVYACAPVLNVSSVFLPRLRPPTDREPCHNATRAYKGFWENKHCSCLAVRQTARSFGPMMPQAIQSRFLEELPRAADPGRAHSGGGGALPQDVCVGGGGGRGGGGGELAKAKLSDDEVASFSRRSHPLVCPFLSPTLPST